MQSTRRPRRPSTGQALTVVGDAPARTGLAFAAAVTHAYNATRSGREEPCSCGSSETRHRIETERLGGRGPVLFLALACKCGMRIRLVREASPQEAEEYYSIPTGDQIAARMKHAALADRAARRVVAAQNREASHAAA